MNNLGNIYRSGIGTFHDHARVLYYYNKAAQLGDPGAMANLGSYYLFRDEDK
jgi:TPR repeat protein